MAEYRIEVSALRAGKKHLQYYNTNSLGRALQVVESWNAKPETMTVSLFVLLERTSKTGIHYHD